MTPQEYRESLFRSLHYSSYSRMTTFFDCGKFFENQYVLGMKPEFEAPALAKGNLLHEYYSVLNDTNSTQEQIKETVGAFTKKYPLEFMKYSRKWKEHVKTLPPGNIILVEKEMRMDVPIPEPLVEPSTGKKFMSVVFKGFIDYLNMNLQHTAYMVDFKSGRASTAPKYADQLAIYALMIFSTYPNIQNVLAYTYDISDNMTSEVSEQNSFEFVRERDYDTLMDTLSKMVWSVIDSALKGKFTPTPCMRCSYCPDYTCKYNRTPQSKRGATGNQPASPPVQTQEYDTYAPPKLEEEPKKAPAEIIPAESVTPIGDREKQLLMDLKKKLDKQARR